MVDKSKLDVTQVFLTFMQFVGDADRTALALGLDVSVVVELAQVEGWVEKVQALTVMSKGGKPGDYERAANRALNYVQAHQLRATLGAVISKLGSEDIDTVLANLLPAAARQTVVLSSKFFSDLATAVERVQGMTYTALGDSVGERTARAADGDGRVNADAMHAAVIASLNSMPMRDITPEKVIAAAQDIVPT